MIRLTVFNTVMAFILAAIIGSIAAFVFSKPRMQPLGEYAHTAPGKARQHVDLAPSPAVARAKKTSAARIPKPVTLRKTETAPVPLEAVVEPMPVFFGRRAGQ